MLNSYLKYLCKLCTYFFSKLNKIIVIIKKIIIIIIIIIIIVISNVMQVTWMFQSFFRQITLQLQIS